MSAFNEQKVGFGNFSLPKWAEFPKFILSMAMGDFDMEEPCLQFRSPGIKRTIGEDVLSKAQNQVCPVEF